MRAGYCLEWCRVSDSNGWHPNSFASTAGSDDAIAAWRLLNGLSSCLAYLLRLLGQSLATV